MVKSKTVRDGLYKSMFLQGELFIGGGIYKF